MCACVCLIKITVVDTGHQQQLLGQKVPVPQWAKMKPISIEPQRLFTSQGVVCGLQILLPQ